MPRLKIVTQKTKMPTIQSTCNAHHSRKSPLSNNNNNDQKKNLQEFTNHHHKSSFVETHQYNVNCPPCKTIYTWYSKPKTIYDTKKLSDYQQK